MQKSAAVSVLKVKGFCLCEQIDTHYFIDRTGLLQYATSNSVSDSLLDQRLFISKVYFKVKQLLWLLINLIIVYLVYCGSC